MIFPFQLPQARILSHKRDRIRTDEGGIQETNLKEPLTSQKLQLASYQRIAFTDHLPQDVKAFTTGCNDIYLQL